jgi:alpha-tubulin suppressor-like RCC1 family protein
VAMCCGEIYTCVVMLGGGVKCWGAGGAGRTGRGSNSNTGATSTTIPSLLSNVSLPLPMASIACKNNHACAVSTNGSVWCW